jgi:hypothetical protein
MKIYIAGISGEQQYGKSLRTFWEIKLQRGDLKQDRFSGRGDVARMLAGEDFYERKEFDAIALYDLDMLHTPDNLEQLRAHDLDMVTGHYYARNARNIHSIWSAVGDGKYPFPPMTDVPRTGLHQIGMTGAGCVLIKRTVYEAVLNYLPKGDHPFAIGPAPQLTGDHRPLGTDWRFFTIAQHLGFKLWGDADVQARHGVVFWLNHEMADKLRDPNKERERLEEMDKILREERGMDTVTLELRIKKLETRKNDYQVQADQMARNHEFLTRQIEQLQAVINDELWLLQNWDPQTQAAQGEQFPTVPENERAETLATRTTLPDASEVEAKAARSSVLAKEATGFVEDLNAIRTKAA